MGLKRARVDEHLPQCKHSIVHACRVARARETIGLPSLLVRVGRTKETNSLQIHIFWCVAFHEHED